MHRGDDRLFADAGAIEHWKGLNTWLDAFFANDLLIFGLGLGRDEVFLRWLLIERARYCQKFGIQDRDGWYVRVEGESDPDRDFLLEHVGVRCVDVARHDVIYFVAEVWTRLNTKIQRERNNNSVHHPDGLVMSVANMGGAAPTHSLGNGIMHLKSRVEPHHALSPGFRPRERPSGGGTRGGVGLRGGFEP